MKAADLQALRKLADGLSRIAIDYSTPGPRGPYFIDQNDEYVAARLILEWRARSEPEMARALARADEERSRILTAGP
jgi:hypothetical protein